MDFLETCRSKLGSKVDQYKQVVAENDVDGEVLADMTDEQLQRQALCVPCRICNIHKYNLTVFPPFQFGSLIADYRFMVY